MGSLNFLRAKRVAIVVVALYMFDVLGLAGCSVYMEATRPTPVDLSEFDIGQTRDSVLERLGAPQTTVSESDGASCDLYQLYTKGYGAGGKIPIAIAEGAADVFTLGLAEILLTPTEGVTKNDKHAVTFCYRDQKIVRVTGEGATQVAETPAAPTAGSESAAATAPSSGALPSPTAKSSPAVTASPAATATPTPASQLSQTAQSSPAAVGSPAAAASPLPAAKPSASSSTAN